MPIKAEFPAKLQRLFEPMRYKVVFGGRGGGKCLKVGTKVIMADGSLRAIEDVRVGEQVMGPDSKPRNVLNVTRGTGPLYEIKQTSGMTYVVNEHHILSLKKSASAIREGRWPDCPEITNIAIGEVLSKKKKWRDNFRGYRAGLLHYPAQSVLIDPYFLGVWLGDGTARELQITNCDPEVIDYLKRYAESNGGTCAVKPHKCNSFSTGLYKRDGRFNVFWEPFKTYGLPENKHIPQAYQANSEKNRLALLAGLLDTDGHFKTNGYQIVQVRENLAREIKYLADGLGFRTKIKERETICTNNGARGKAWSVYIGGDAWRIPCLVKRKKCHKESVSKNKDWRLSEITINPIGLGEYAGFALDGDHLFCLEDGTVTHNSWSIARSLVILGAQRKLRIFCGREFQNSIQQSVHALLSDQVAALELGSFYEIQKTQILGANGTQFSFHGLRHNPDSIKSAEGCDIAWIEEANNVSKDSWDKLIPTIRKDGSEIWISFNPELDTDETYKRFVHQPPKNAVLIQMNWSDNPWFPSVLKDEMHDLRDRDYDSYLTVWEGHCRQTLDGAVYANELRKATLEQRVTRVPVDSYKGVHVFADLGWSDSTSIWFAQRCALENRILRSYQSQHQPWSHYIQFIRETGYSVDTLWLPHDARAKQLGTGKSIEEISREHGFKVRIVPSLSVVDGINAARHFFDQCYFDQQLCEDGLHSLRRYVWDKSAQGLATKAPKHDEHSHYADAFRYMAIGFTEPVNMEVEAQKVIKRLQSNNITLNLGSGGDSGWMN